MPSRPITARPHGHVLTNIGCWSPDSRWIVYDVRSTADGGVFDGTRIERVEVDTGRVEQLYAASDDACCGVVTASPVDDRVVFILGPERPTADWQYGPAHRQGVVVRTSRPGAVERLDARDLVPPFTSGALRGGSHVHVFSPDGRLVSFTYEDATLAAFGGERVGGLPPREKNLRGIAVSVCGRPVVVPKTHPRNHDGSAFTVAVTRLTDAPRPDSDEISKAFEEGWIGTAGYLRADGTRQRYALAFQGHVATADGGTISEVFVCDLPDDPDRLMEPGDGPLAGTSTSRPVPSRGVSQRRLTFTADRSYPGIQGPRHWLRSSPDGARIAFLLRDDAGVVQIFTVSPQGGEPQQLTRNPWDIASAFTWSPDGRRIAFIADGSVQLVDVATGATTRLTDRGKAGTAIRPEACVFSPDGRRIAFVQTVGAERTIAGDAGDDPDQDAAARNQVFVVDVPE
jgi:hypothetical protein